MNKERREELNEVNDLLEEASERLQEIISDEQDSYDDLSEGLQFSKTGESMLAAIDEMESIDDDIHKVEERVSLMIKPPKKKK